MSGEEGQVQEGQQQSGAGGEGGEVQQAEAPATPQEWSYEYAGTPYTKDEVEQVFRYAQQAGEYHRSLESQLAEVRAEIDKRKEQQEPGEPKDPQIERLEQIEKRLEQKEAQDKQRDQQETVRQITEKFDRLIGGHDLLNRISSISKEHASALRSIIYSFQSQDTRVPGEKVVERVGSLIKSIMDSAASDYARGKVTDRQSAPPSSSPGAPASPKPRKYTPEDAWGNGEGADDFDREIQLMIAKSSQPE